MACKTCRIRKIRCDQTRPVCRNCTMRDAHCTYAGERRKRRSTYSSFTGRRPSPATIIAGGRLRGPSTTEDSVTLGQSQSQSHIQHGSIPVNDNGTSYHLSASDCLDHVAGAKLSRDLQQPIASAMSIDFPSPDPTDVACSPSSHSAVPSSSSLLDRILQGNDMEHTRTPNPAVWMRTGQGDEYTGPSSGISMISDLGLKWIRRHVPDSCELYESIHDIRNTLLSLLTLPKCTPPDSPSPSFNGPGRCLTSVPSSIIETYVDFYFTAVQTLFPVLDRQSFQLQLVEYGTNPASPSSWKALFAAVLASGCRAALSQETAEAFKHSSRESWGYFQTALSYESDIIHNATDLMAVQAFAVMTIYAQGLSSPQRVEFTLCSITSRLAQSIGLNRHPSPEWNLSEDEKQHRNRVFWVIYCLDKTIALRCGRPSVIHDDDISCGFPRPSPTTYEYDSSPGIPTERAAEFNYFLCMTKLARICGAVSRKLYSAAALYSTPNQLSGTMDSLLRDLELWKEGVPADIRPGTAFTRLAASRSMSRFQLLVLHSTYYYVQCAIYRRVTPLFTDSQTVHSVFNEATKAKNIEAARSMVLLTKHLDVESFTPGWLAFYYPFTAFTTIFVHVVTNPRDESIHRDIALMEVIVGFFGRLEFITSGEAAFTKMSEFVRQARRIVGRQSNVPSNQHERRASYSHDVATRPDFSDSQLSNSRAPLQGVDEMHADNGSRVGSLHSQHAASFQQSSSSNGNHTITLGKQQQPPTRPARHAAQESSLGNSGGGRRSSVEISSQNLFSDVLDLLERNPVDIMDDNWLEDWALTDQVGST